MNQRIRLLQSGLRLLHRSFWLMVEALERNNWRSARIRWMQVRFCLKATIRAAFRRNS